MEQLPLEDIERFSRQLLLSSWSEQKQLALGKALVALPCTLSSAALYLLGAGVRNLVLIGSPNEGLGLIEKLRCLDPEVEALTRPDLPVELSALITEDLTIIDQTTQALPVVLLEAHGPALYKGNTLLKRVKTPVRGPECASLFHGTVAAGLILYGLLMNYPEN